MKLHFQGKKLVDLNFLNLEFLPISQLFGIGGEARQCDGFMKNLRSQRILPYLGYDRDNLLSKSRHENFIITITEEINK